MTNKDIICNAFIISRKMDYLELTIRFLNGKLEGKSVTLPCIDVAEMPVTGERATIFRYKFWHSYQELHEELCNPNTEYELKVRMSSKSDEFAGWDLTDIVEQVSVSRASVALADKFDNSDAKLLIGENAGIPLYVIQLKLDFYNIYWRDHGDKF